jgi:pilus assembly protein CpaE
MAAFIVSDQPGAATHLRRVLLSQGRDCPLTHVISLEEANRLSGVSADEVMFLVLPDHPGDAVALIRQLRASNYCRIVGVGVPHEPRAILEALHAGADDYIDQSSDLESQAADVLVRVEGVRRDVHSISKVVSITSASGGVGCTTIASNLAVSFAQRFKGCGLIDLASEHGEVGDHFDIKPKHTLGELLRNIDSLDSKVVAESLPNHPNGVSLLAGGLSSEDLEQCPPSDVDRLMKLVRPSRPCWVIDADRMSMRRFRLAQLVDSIVLVLRLDFPSLCRARRILDEWQDLQIDPQRILIVANRTGQPAEIPPIKVDSFLHRPVDVCLPDDPFNATVSLNCGVPLLTEAPKSKLAEQIHSLAGRIVPTGAAEATPKSDSGIQSFARLLRSITVVPT